MVCTCAPIFGGVWVWRPTATRDVKWSGAHQKSALWHQVQVGACQCADLGVGLALGVCRGEKGWVLGAFQKSASARQCGAHVRRFCVWRTLLDPVRRVVSSGQVLVSECRLGCESRDDVHMCSDFGRGLGLETHCDERCQVVGRAPKIGTLASGSGWCMSVCRFLGGPGPRGLSRRE